MQKGTLSSKRKSYEILGEVSSLALVSPAFIFVENHYSSNGVQENEINKAFLTRGLFKVIRSVTELKWLTCPSRRHLTLDQLLRDS